MTVEEIMESEERDENNLFEIHFYLEGSFWRAYEWSAYLSRNFPSNLDDGERLRVIKKITKSCEEGFVQVGLQLKSFDKYFPNITNNDDLFEVNDRHITIHAKDFFPQITFESYVNTFSEWKRTIEPSNKEKKKYSDSINKELTKPTIEQVLNEIISYPIENKNLVECLQFLSHIKSDVIKITNEKMNS